MIRKIEHWALNGVSPTFDDRESVTALELVGKNTTKVNEVVDIVNKFIDDINLTIEKFITGQTKEFEVFRIEINQKIQDFIDVINLRCDGQDKLIDETIIWIKNNVSTYILENFELILTDLFKEGKLDEGIYSMLEEIRTELNTALTNHINEVNTRLAGFETTVNNHVTETSESLNEISNELTEVAASVNGILPKNGVFQIEIPFDISTTGNFGGADITNYQDLLNYVDNGGKPTVIFTDTTNKQYIATFNKKSSTNYSTSQILTYSFNLLSNGELYVRGGSTYLSMKLVFNLSIYNDDTKSFGISVEGGTSPSSADSEFVKNGIYVIEDVRFSFDKHIPNTIQTTTSSSVISKFQAMVNKFRYLTIGNDYMEGMFLLRDPQYSGLFALRTKDDTKLVYRSINKHKNNNGSNDLNEDLGCEITLNIDSSKNITSIDYQIIDETITSKTGDTTFTSYWETVTLTELKDSEDLTFQYTYTPGELTAKSINIMGVSTASYHNGGSVIYRPGDDRIPYTVDFMYHDAPELNQVIIRATLSKKDDTTGYSASTDNPLYIDVKFIIATTNESKLS